MGNYTNDEDLKVSILSGKGTIEDNKEQKITVEVFEPNEILFYVNEKWPPIIRLSANGKIFVNEKLADTDKQVVDAMREFLKASGFLK